MALRRGDTGWQYLHTDEVPLQPLSPTAGPLAPDGRPQYHGDSCSCSSCEDIRTAVQIHLKRKSARDINDWWNS